MQPIDQALQQLRALHEELLRVPAPEITPQMFQPFPLGTDPVTYAIGEVDQFQRAAARSRPSSQPQPPTWIPRASVFTGNASSLFVLEIPGVRKQDVSITVIGSELIVRGERKPPAIEGELRPALVEQTWGEFERRFPMPTWCTPESISAHCVNGILEIGMSANDEQSSAEYQVKIG